MFCDPGQVRKRGMKRGERESKAVRCMERTNSAQGLDTLGSVAPIGIGVRSYTSAHKNLFSVH